MTAALSTALLLVEPGSIVVDSRLERRG